MKTKQRTIWQNYNVEPDNEFCPELTEEERIERAYQDNEMFLADERRNLDIQLYNPILVVASLGLWNGRKSGYKIIQSGNIKDILYTDCDYAEWYSDGKDILARMSHHDGTNYYLYREIKDVDRIDVLLDKIYNDKHTRTDINRYTRSILPHVARVYGWPCDIKEEAIR